MTDPRKRHLEKSGNPEFKGSHASRTWNTKVDYSVPSDIHMFWEAGMGHPQKGEGNVAPTLSVVLVGNANPPDLTQYADIVKKVVFFGHICRMKTALQMVTQLRACESVEFFLGSKEQLELYHFDDSNLLSPVDKENDLVLDGGVNSRVVVVTVRTNVSQNSPTEKKAIKEIVLKQIESVLSFGPKMWPSVKKMVVDLPGDGIYLDMVKEYLPMWSGIHQTHGVEMRNTRICLGRRVRKACGLSGQDSSNVGNASGNRAEKIYDGKNSRAQADFPRMTTPISKENLSPHVQTASRSDSIVREDISPVKINFGRSSSELSQSPPKPTMEKDAITLDGGAEDIKVSK